MRTRGAKIRKDYQESQQGEEGSGNKYIGKKERRRGEYRKSGEKIKGG